MDEIANPLQSAQEAPRPAPLDLSSSSRLRGHLCRPFQTPARASQGSQATSAASDSGVRSAEPAPKRPKTSHDNGQIETPQPATSTSVEQQPAAPLDLEGYGKPPIPAGTVRRSKRISEASGLSTEGQEVVDPSPLVGPSSRTRSKGKGKAKAVTPELKNDDESDDEDDFGGEDVDSELGSCVDPEEEVDDDDDSDAEMDEDWSSPELEQPVDSQQGPDGTQTVVRTTGALQLLKPVNANDGYQERVGKVDPDMFQAINVGSDVPSDSRTRRQRNDDEATF